MGFPGSNKWRYLYHIHIRPMSCKGYGSGDIPPMFFLDPGIPILISWDFQSGKTRISAVKVGNWIGESQDFSCEIDEMKIELGSG